jgi:hypothetical protein
MAACEDPVTSAQVPPARPPSGFERLWQSLALDAHTLTLPPLATLSPRRHRPDTDERRHAIAGLPEIPVAEAGPSQDTVQSLADLPGAELQLGVTLGKGGMGLVRAATQVSLRRTVAVKTLQPQHLRDETTHELLREARLTGQLEHPNIIPVYALGRDAAGAPMLVMKRVEGSTWRDLLDAEEPAPLERHLAILTQVCNAVHYAHSKGIVHRDLKPENVMLGQYGEVYLVDWGIALQLGETRQVTAGSGIAGTPAFMAPEMVSGDAVGLGVHTDVYLLGACLHTLLTGTPPHEGHDLFAVLYHAWASEPHAYGPNIPTELASLCHAAMAHDPAQRPVSAEAFRMGIEDFLQHRTSRQLAAEAAWRLEAMQTLWASEDPNEDEDLAAERMTEVYHVFGEARFGFTQALRTWQGNAQAAEGLQTLLEGMARYEIRHGDHRAAAVLVADLQAPPEDLRGELDALARKLLDADAELKKLKAMERDMDLEAGRDVRSAFAWVMAIVWAVAPAAVYVAQRTVGFTVSYASYVGASVLFVALSVACIWMYRTDLMQNRANRAVVRMVLITTAVTLAHRVVVVLQGMPVPQALVQDLLIYAFALGSLAVTVDRRIGWGAGVFLLAALIAPLVMEHLFLVFAVADLVALGSVAAVWSPRNLCDTEHRVVLMRLRHSRRLRQLLLRPAT